MAASNDKPKKLKLSSSTTAVNDNKQKQKLSSSANSKNDDTQKNKSFLKIKARSHNIRQSILDTVRQTTTIRHLHATKRFPPPRDRRIRLQ